ncbi:hypothetical protein HDV57DRAFT_1995 [Trichoderma longibrachiatum]
MTSAVCTTLDATLSDCRPCCPYPDYQVQVHYPPLAVGWPRCNPWELWALYYETRRSGSSIGLHSSLRATLKASWARSVSLGPLPEIQHKQSCRQPLGFADCLSRHSSALVSPNGPRHGSPCSIFIYIRNTLLPSFFLFLLPRQHLARRRVVLGNQRNYPQILERESGARRDTLSCTLYMCCHRSVHTYFWSVMKHKGMKRLQPQTLV